MHLLELVIRVSVSAPRTRRAFLKSWMEKLEYMTPGLKISVAMATYNGARFLPQQLESLASQTRLPFELQVGDDGSTDGTLDLLDEFAARAPFPVRVHRNSTQLGFGENFLQTAQRCSGNWIAFCDQDDIWFPEKLAAAEKAVLNGPQDLCLFCHDADVGDKQLQPVGRLYGYRRPILHRPLSLSPEWICAGFTQVFRASLVRDVPVSPRPSFPDSPEVEPHDLWIALLSNVLGFTCIHPAPLAFYRRHDGSTTTYGARPSLARSLVSHTRSRGDVFTQRADYLERVAHMLLDAASRSTSPDAFPMLNEAARKLRIQSSFYEMRAAAYCGGTPKGRLTAFGKSVAKGVYFGRQGWPFGGLRLVKDFAYSVLNLERRLSGRPRKCNPRPPSDNSG